MYPNCVKLVRAITFLKNLASVVSFIFLPKTLIWNKITFPASNSLNFAELVKNELMMSLPILRKNTPIYLFLFNLLLLTVKFLRVYN